MTAHELADKLLAGPDLTVICSDRSDDGDGSEEVVYLVEDEGKIRIEADFPSGPWAPDTSHRSETVSRIGDMLRTSYAASNHSQRLPTALENIIAKINARSN